jgi:hypothetical protein
MFNKTIKNIFFSNNFSVKSDYTRELRDQNRKEVFFVPAGVDLGKDMEERLKRTPDDDSTGIGPKQLTNPDFPSESSDLPDEGPDENGNNPDFLDNTTEFEPSVTG